MARRRNSDLHGLLVIDKPRGLTSHDVVDWIRKLTGVRRVGHAGTLDPFATGVLVVAVGKATRFLRYVTKTRKRYLAQIVLGIETDTGDLEGKIISATRPEIWPEVQVVEDCLELFTGTITQTPPIYSAVRIDGKHAYQRARAGEDVKVPSREVVVHSAQIVGYSAPDLHLDIECGSGTYIRSLARDIGAALGAAGYCHDLRRTRVGSFCLCQSWTLDQLLEIDIANCWPQTALHPAVAVAEFRAVVLSSEFVTPWMNGNEIPLSDVNVDASESVRVYSCQGQFIGIGSVGTEAGLKPSLVFNTMS